MALFNFMQGKELAGQERAVGVEGFSRGYFDDELQARLLHLQEGQERCFDIFGEFADTAANALWQQILSTDTVAQVISLRGVAKRTSVEAQIDPGLCEPWFELNTLRIDAMKQVESHLTQRLLERCRRSIAEAHADLDNHRALLGRVTQMDAGSDLSLIHI